MSVEARPSVGAAHRSLRDSIADELRERIISGAYPPDFRLVERDLAQQLEVSRIPLREAFRQLESEGLVRALPRRGVVVASMSAKDVENLFEIRESLESLAARLAAQRADQQGLQRLRAHLDDARAATTAADKDGIARANAAFHATIIDLADNELLHSMMTPLNSKVRWLFRITSETDPEMLCREHAELFDAIAAGNADQASRIALEHVAASRQPTFAQLGNPQ